MDFVVLRCGCGSLLWHFSGSGGKFSGLVLEPRDPETQLDDVVRCLVVVLVVLLLLLSPSPGWQLHLWQCHRTIGNNIFYILASRVISLFLSLLVQVCFAAVVAVRDTQMLLRDTLASTRYFSATCLQHLCGLSGLSRPCVHLLNRSQAKNYSQTLNPSPLSPFSPCRVSSTTTSRISCAWGQPDESKSSCDLCN